LEEFQVSKNVELPGKSDLIGTKDQACLNCSLAGEIDGFCPDVSTLTLCGDFCTPSQAL
jgi:hypothetical protein